MTVRDARLPQDEPAILSYIEQLQDFEAAFEPNRSRAPDFAVSHWRNAQHVCAEKHGAMFIAEQDGAPVGWAFCHEMHGELFIAEPERRHGFIAELFVVQAARGAGHGRALIAACEAWSRARGHKLVIIGVLAGNVRAVRAYQGAGYAPYNILMRRYLEPGRERMPRGGICMTMAGFFEMSFLSAFLANPLKVASPLPSGPVLARAIAGEVDPARPGTVLELGPGSGAVTAALLQRVEPSRLLAIEHDEEFCRQLRLRFPGLALMQGDAFHFDELIKTPLAAIVSGLPILVLKDGERRAFLDTCLAHLPVGAPFIQFSYSAMPPIPAPPGVTVKSRIVWANLPPMHVWRYARTALA